ncbi:P-loop containing nucleoside triphosphate hydrolase protein [Haematococcus lacustris]
MAPSPAPGMPQAPQQPLHTNPSPSSRAVSAPACPTPAPAAGQHTHLSCASLSTARPAAGGGTLGMAVSTPSALTSPGHSLGCPSHSSATPTYTVLGAGHTLGDHDHSREGALAAIHSGHTAADPALDPVTHTWTSLTASAVPDRHPPHSPSTPPQFTHSFHSAAAHDPSTFYPAPSPAVLTVQEADVLQLVAEATGIPTTRLNHQGLSALLDLERQLGGWVVGQGEAVAAVASLVRLWRSGLLEVGRLGETELAGSPAVALAAGGAGLLDSSADGSSSSSRPGASFVLTGPPGVGKRSLCRALAALVLEDPEAVIQVPCAEYADRASLAKLLGAPPGYVGYGRSAGTLVDRVRRQPHCLVLFEEVAKAHPEVQQVLARILHEGRLTDSLGRTASFASALVAFTHTSSTKFAPSSVTPVGLQSADDDAETVGGRLQTVAATSAAAALDDQQDTGAAKRPSSEVSPAMAQILGHVDLVVPFRSLHSSAALELVDKQIIAATSQLSRSPLARGVQLVVQPKARAWLAERGVTSLGAAPLAGVMRTRVLGPLAEALLRRVQECGVTGAAGVAVLDVAHEQADALSLELRPQGHSSGKLE